jgi:hypothetical protein
MGVIHDGHRLQHCPDVLYCTCCAVPLPWPVVTVVTSNHYNGESPLAALLRPFTASARPPSHYSATLLKICHMTIFPLADARLQARSIRLD